MKDLVTEFGMGIIFITHDLGVIAQTADRVAVMYLGKIVETGSVRQIIRAPEHPYTKGLLNALPNLDDLGAPLTPVAGDIPSPLERPPGCVFHTRCPRVMAGRCDAEVPEITDLGAGHNVSCLAVTPAVETPA
jgi:oligopeptide/dipeptide ABC transporter ATP-binding protein